MSDIIILGWPRRSGMMGRLFGERITAIIESVDKTTFVCDFVQPLALHKRMLIASLPLSERESGFDLWFIKMTKLAQELSLIVVYYCDEVSRNRVIQKMKQLSIVLPIEFVTFYNWSDFRALSENGREGDLFVFAAARKGSVSYRNDIENLPFRIQRYFANTSKVLVYPQQYSSPDRAAPQPFRAVPDQPEKAP